MNIARILYPVKVLGLGNRIGIWVCGCSLRCRGCSNPELWERQEKHEIYMPNIKKLIGDIAAVNKIDGFTITGGEPMEQPSELSELVAFLSLISEDIIIYTGYSLEELKLNHSTDIKNILSSIAVLIDGNYIEERNVGIPLRGSDNQNVYVLNQKYKKIYDDYFVNSQNQIQNFTTADGIISVGIHEKEFNKKFEEKIKGF